MGWKRGVYPMRRRGQVRELIREGRIDEDERRKRKQISPRRGLVVL